MKIEQAHNVITSSASDDVGAFYGAPQGLSLGAGLIVSNVEFPGYAAEEDKFVIWSGPVLVLSHECDLDPANSRLLNDIALICPVRSLEAIVEMASLSGYPDTKLSAFLSALGSRSVNRAVYFPPLSGVLPYGGFIYLNQLTHTSVNRLETSKASPIAALTSFAMQSVDYALQEHLFRHKSERLPLSMASVRRSRSVIK